MKNINKRTATIALLTLSILCSCSKVKLDTPQPSGPKVTGVEIVNLQGDAIILGGHEPMTKQVQVAATPSSAEDLDKYYFTCYSSDNSVFTVDETGMLTCIGAGEATLNVVARNNARIATSCRVKSIGVLVGSIDVKPGGQTIALTQTPGGATYSAKSNITVSPSNATVKELVFSSSDPAIATVDPATGIVSAVWEGQTAIRATATDGSGVYGEFTVDVAVVRADSVTLSAAAQTLTIETPNTYTLNVGASSAYSIYVQPGNVSSLKMSFNSSDPTIASVNEAGVISGLSSGTAYITATTTDGSNKAVTATVNVVKYLFTPLDPSTWMLTSSPVDMTLGAHSFGDLSNMVDDPALNTGVAFFKVGNQGVPSTGAYFTVDFGTPAVFNYFQIAHKMDFNPTSGSYLYEYRYNLVKDIRFYGSDDDLLYTDLQNVTGLANTNSDPKSPNLVRLSATHTWRYVKCVLTPTYPNYNSGGDYDLYMFVKDFQLGLYTLAP
ncbi:hypothetical protein FACS1894159_05700 [Bacteroidia bacterium]|nr:hypothetical protein FACS1894159_05700 [Bacteroidia bacterium]